MRAGALDAADSGILGSTDYMHHAVTIQVARTASAGKSLGKRGFFVPPFQLSIFQVLPIKLCMKHSMDFQRDLGPGSLF